MIGFILRQEYDGRQNAEGRSHVDKDKAYKLASSFGDVLDFKQGRVEKYQGEVIDGHQTQWSSTFDMIPEGVD